MRRFTAHRDRMVERQVAAARIRDQRVALPPVAVPARRSLNMAAHKLPYYREPRF